MPKQEIEIVRLNILKRPFGLNKATLSYLLENIQKYGPLATQVIEYPDLIDLITAPFLSYDLPTPATGPCSASSLVRKVVAAQNKNKTPTMSFPNPDDPYDRLTANIDNARPCFLTPGSREGYFNRVWTVAGLQTQIQLICGVPPATLDILLTHDLIFAFNN